MQASAGQEQACEANHHRKFSDEYSLGACLGDGGFATVRACERKASGEMLAVKVAIFPKGKMAEAQVLLLRREEIILKSLDHPNILKIRALAPSTRRPFLALLWRPRSSRFGVCALCCALAPAILMGSMHRQTTRRLCLALLQRPRSDKSGVCVLQS